MMTALVAVALTLGAGPQREELPWLPIGFAASLSATGLQNTMLAGDVAFYSSALLPGWVRSEAT